MIRAHLGIVPKVKKQITGEQSYYISFIKILSAAKLYHQLRLCSMYIAHIWGKGQLRSPVPANFLWLQSAQNSY